MIWLLYAFAKAYGRFSVADGYPLNLYLWYIAWSATAAMDDWWGKGLRIAAVLNLAIAHGVSQFVGKANVIPFMNDNPSKPSNRFTAIYFVACVGAYVFAEAVCRALRQTHHSDDRNSEAFDEMIASLIIKSALTGPVVLYYTVTMISAQNAILDGLVDFCSRVDGATHVGPFEWSWEGCEEREIYGRFEPTAARAEGFASTVRTPDELMMHLSAEAILRSSIEYVKISQDTAAV